MYHTQSGCVRLQIPLLCLQYSDLLQDVVHRRLLLLQLQPDLDTVGPLFHHCLLRLQSGLYDVAGVAVKVQLGQQRCYGSLRDLRVIVFGT